MPIKTVSKKGPAGRRKRGPLNLMRGEQDRVRRAARRLHAIHGSDAAVDALCEVHGHPLTAATVCRVRNDVPAGRKVAEAIAAALGVEVAKLLAGRVKA